MLPAYEYAADISSQPVVSLTISLLYYGLLLTYVPKGLTSPLLNAHINPCMLALCMAVQDGGNARRVSAVRDAILGGICRHKGVVQDGNPQSNLLAAHVYMCASHINCFSCAVTDTACMG